MRLALRKFLLVRLIYLLVLIAGAVVLYWLIPREVWDTIRDTYLSRTTGELAP